VLAVECDGADLHTIEGVADTPYNVPLALQVHHPKVNVPVLWWRSVGHTHTAFVMETLVDEIARSTGQDPVAYRRGLINAKHQHHLAALDLAVEKSGYGKKQLPKGQAFGVAVHESFNSYVAEVAEVSVAGDGSFKVERVVCAVDCGTAVNPDVIKAQMEGGIGYGLSAILKGEITLKDGAMRCAL